MDIKLARLIEDYQAHVAKAVALLERAGVPRPKSSAEWASQRSLASPDLGDGFIARKHGFGCSVSGPAWAVDFDFGDAGQIDGFDPWRLESFAKKRLEQYGFESSKDVRTAFDRAREAGDVVSSGYVLYYVA